MKKLTCVFATAALSLLAITQASATDYPFTVSCPDRALVEVWKTGDIDPGKEYLRTMTGVNNPGCSISDYNAASDAYLPQETHEGAGGVLAGIPPLQILCGIFGC